ncbi:hypothetical protein BN2475_400075 [Paraburkholderia ribeironis]|uniref:Uncharacterized protein n=1 Tax=Paraburkholderia ribeironis TaxID=1247936 RepID=A0A1N7S6U5_9BURK|nr:hypothetical protein BN2475_400075 [Paraburkholderia ribeironis]
MEGDAAAGNAPGLRLGSVGGALSGVVSGAGLSGPGRLDLQRLSLDGCNDRAAGAARVA